MEKDYLEQSAQNTIQARQILEESRLIPLWQTAGATVHLIGSLAIGTLGKHLDIDLHIYTDELDILQSLGLEAVKTLREILFDVIHRSQNGNSRLPLWTTRAERPHAILQ